MAKDKLLPVMFSGWRSAINHIVEHPFWVAFAIRYEGQSSFGRKGPDETEFSFFWLNSLESAVEYHDNILAPWCRAANDEDGDHITGIWTAILEVQEDNNKLFAHKASRFLFEDKEEGLKHRKSARQTPELMFFDIPEDMTVEKVRKAIAKAIERRNAKLEEADEDDEVPTDVDDEAEDIETATETAPSDDETAEDADDDPDDTPVTEAEEEALRATLIEAANSLGIPVRKNWKTETIAKKVQAATEKVQAEIGDELAEAKATEEAEDEGGSTEPLLTELQRQTAAKQARQARRERAKAKVADEAAEDEDDGEIPVKKAVRKRPARNAAAKKAS